MGSSGPNRSSRRSRSRRASRPSTWRSTTSIRFGDIRLEVLHTPGHTEGSICLLANDQRLLFTGDTLFRGGLGRVDLPGASPEAMVESLARLRHLEPDLRVLPGHGADSTIERERPWLEMVAQQRRLPF